MHVVENIITYFPTDELKAMLDGLKNQPEEEMSKEELQEEEEVIR